MSGCTPKHVQTFMLGGQSLLAPPESRAEYVFLVVTVELEAETGVQ